MHGVTSDELSMSRRGNCWDNAVAESFFSSLKKGRIKKRIYADRETVVLDVTEYIEGFCNRHAAIAISVALVRLSSKRHTEAADQASTKTWLLHSVPL